MYKPKIITNTPKRRLKPNLEEEDVLGVAVVAAAWFIGILM
jgi:hypothetical protein